MPKAIFTATDAAGQTHKRTSESRIYTHTVVFLPDFAADMALADKDYKQDGSNFAYYCELAAGTHEHVTHVIPRSGYHASYSDEQVAKFQEAQREQNAKGIADAKAVTEGHTRESYVAARRAKRVAAVNEGNAAGYYAKWQNAGWCGRYDLAQKLAAKTAGAKVEILEAVRS